MDDDLITWIQSWIENRGPGEAIAIADDTDLYKSGLLDSLGVIELIEAMEDQYSFMFTEEEMQAGLTNVSDFVNAIAKRKNE